MNIKLDSDPEEGQETLHLLHPDGTMTVQFITTDGVAEGYITQGDEQEFIADASGNYIASDGSTQFILALHSGSPLISPEVTEEEFLDENSVEVMTIANPPLEDNQKIHEDDDDDGKEEHLEDTTTILLEDAPNVAQVQDEQEKRQCANCFSKLIFQRGRSKKLSDPLYPFKGYTTPPSQSLNKHMDKDVTVLEALDLLFDLKIKSMSSSIRLCNDYVFCYKCVSCLLKLHTLFVEFTIAAKSPSFMRSIFSQYGVLNEFSNVVRGVRVKTERSEENESREPTSNIENENEVPESVPDQSKSKLFPSISFEMTEKIVEAPKWKPERIHKARVENPSSPRRPSRLPRSCKKPQNYQALAKVGQYESEPTEENSTNEDENNFNFFLDSQDSLEETDYASFQKLASSIPLKKRRSRLLDLKKRIKAMTELDTPSQGEKRRPGRPRKSSPTLPIALKYEPEEPRPLKKRKFDSADLEIKAEAITDNEQDVDEGEAEVEHTKSQAPLTVDRQVSPYKWNKEIVPSNEEDEETEGDEDYRKKDLKYEKVHRPRGTKKSIQCIKCCARFLKHSHYIDHLTVHSDNKMLCSECNGTFNTPRNLKRHISLYHTVRPKRLPLVREFTCPECSFSFTRKSHLKAHLINQHNIEPDTIIGDFPCPVCGKKNFSDSVLQNHLERKHLVRVREKKNECDQCGRKFLKKSDLDNHTTTHTNIRRFMCEVCGFSSKRPQDLTRHRKLVHLKEVKHSCPTCGKGFLSLWQLKSHQLSHDEFKGFPCPEPGCGKSFRCPNNLRQHIHVHQGVKHVCQYCGDSYSRTAYLQRHIKINHLGIPVPPIKPKKVRDINNSILQRPPRSKKPKRTYELLEENEMDILVPEPMELDIDLPTEDGHTQQVILHGFDDRYEGVIMEYIIG